MFFRFKFTNMCLTILCRTKLYISNVSFYFSLRYFGSIAVFVDTCNELTVSFCPQYLSISFFVINKCITFCMTSPLRILITNPFMLHRLTVLHSSFFTFKPYIVFLCESQLLFCHYPGPTRRRWKPQYIHDRAKKLKLELRFKNLRDSDHTTAQLLLSEPYHRHSRMTLIFVLQSSQCRRQRITSRLRNV